MTGCGGLGGGCKVCVDSPAVEKERNPVQNRTWRNVGLLTGKHIHVKFRSP